ncbi:MAG: hypothetical protein ACFFDP_11105 [Promethearchaeota archaeon]
MGSKERSPVGLTIKVHEHEHTILNSDNTIRRFDPRGRVIVHNGSRTYSIWDAELELNRPNRTTLGTDPLEIGRLDPLGEWEKEFIIKDIESPMLLVTEVIDTYFERVGVNTALVFEQQMPVELTLTLRNHSGATIREIMATKTIPPIFQNIKLLETQAGKVKYDSKANQIIWTIEEMAPDAIAVQRIRATITTEDVQPKGGGKFEVSYRVPEVVRSILVPVLHGSTDSQVSVEKEENPMRGGSWRCKAQLTNVSDFPIRLERVQVVMTSPTSDLLYEGKPDLRLEPGEIWGHEFEVSEEQPEFDIIALSTVEAPLIKEIRGTVEKEENVFPVLHVAGGKRVEPLEIMAWEPVPISITLQAKNIGTTESDEVIFVDFIPAGFEPPEKNQVRVRVGDRPISRSVEVSLHPSERDMNLDHNITIHLHDLTESHSPVKQGETVTANYIITARTPKPNFECSLPLKVKMNTFPPGPPAEAEIKGADAPTIRVRPALRKLRKTRTVVPGSVPGQLLATITFVNESETSLQNPELQDLIPPSFEFKGVPEGSQNPSIRETANGTLLSWSLQTMMSGEKFVTKYIYSPKK